MVFAFFAKEFQDFGKERGVRRSEIREKNFSACSDRILVRLEAVSVRMSKELLAKKVRSGLIFSTSHT